MILGEPKQISKDVIYMTIVEGITYSEPLDHYLKVLRQKGLRLTPQRTWILNYLIECDGYPSADDIYRQISTVFPGISLATIYNNLRVLVEENILYQVRIGTTYHYDFQGHQHGHMICGKCHKICDFFPEHLEQLLDSAIRQTSFKLTKATVEIKGICPSCDQTM